MKGRGIGVDLGDGLLHGYSLGLHLLGTRIAPVDGEWICLEDHHPAPLEPLGSGGKGRSSEVECVLRGRHHPAEPGSPVESHRYLAHRVEMGLDAPLLELPDRPIGGVVVGVRTGDAAAEAVGGVVGPLHDLVIGGAELDDLLDDRVVLRIQRGRCRGQGGSQGQEADGQPEIVLPHGSSDPLRGVRAGPRVGVAFLHRLAG